MPASVVCFPEFTKASVDYKTRRRFEAKNRAIIQAQNNGEITAEQAVELQHRLHAEVDVALNDHQVGGYQGPRLNILRTLSTSTSPTARKFGRKLLVGSERASYQSESVPAEALGIRLRNNSVTKLAKEYRDGYAEYMRTNGYSLIDRFGRAAGAAAEGTYKAGMDRVGKVTGKEADPVKMESIAREFQREVFEYSNMRRPADPKSPASQTAEMMRQQIAEFNSTARALGFPEEELSPDPPMFLDVSLFRQDSGDRLRFVRATGNGEWSLESATTNPLTGEEVVENITVTPHISEQMFDEFQKKYADYTHEQELPKQMTFRDNNNNEVILKLDFNKENPLDQFIVQDSQATMQRYFTTMAHRVAMRTKGLADENYDIAENIKAKLLSDKKREYERYLGREVSEVYGGFEIDGKQVSLSRIEQHYDNIEKNMTGAMKALAGRPPEIDTMMVRLSNAFPRAIQRLSQFNLVTKLAGIAISASTDLGGLQATLGASGAKSMALAAARKPPQELQDTIDFMAAAQESAAGWVTARQAGFSMNTSVRSSPFDSALNSAVQGFGSITGINKLNDFIQRGAIFGVQDGIVREIIEGGDAVRFTGLMDRWGIKAKMRDEMKELVLEHGSYNGDGPRSMGIQNWAKGVTDPEELKRIRNLQENVSGAFASMALDHTMLPFTGTLPLWAQNPASKLVLEFRSIIFSSWMRLIQAPIERGRFSRDDLVALTSNIGLGYMVYETKRQLYGRPEAEDDKDLAMSIAGEMSHTALPMMALYGANLFLHDVPGMHKPSIWSAAMFMGGPSVDTARQAINVSKQVMGMDDWDSPISRKARASFIPYRSHPAFVPLIREYTEGGE